MTGQNPMLEKVQKLLDKAFSTTFEEEKKSLLAKADELMMKFSIDEFMLQDPDRPMTARPIKGSEPELRTMEVYPQDRYWDMDYEVRNGLVGMFQSCATHFGCRLNYAAAGQMKVVGYPADLDWLDMMFLSLKLDFMKQIDPSVAVNEPWTVSLLALKQSGRKWEDIHKMLQVHPNYDYKGMAWERRMGVRFTGIYKKWRDEHPDEPANVSSPKMWREDFIIGYCHRISGRLYEMRKSTLSGNDNLPALLADKKSKVDEYYDEWFPPPPPVDTSNLPKVKAVTRYRAPKYRAVSTAARSAGASAANRADLNQRNSRMGGSPKGEL
jgi:Protein of unknown function (DUF2786)